MRDHGSLGRAAELAGDREVPAGGAKQVLQGTHIGSAVAEALDRVVGRQGRDLSDNREQERERCNGREEAADGAASERMHPAG